MSVEPASGRRLLSANEFTRVAESHYPALGRLSPSGTLALVRWLRSEKTRLSDTIRRRAHRGTAAPAGRNAPANSERGLAVRKQVFARAIKRVNARLEHCHAEPRRAETLANLRAALERKRSARVHHPPAGFTANQGMRPTPSTLPADRNSGTCWPTSQRPRLEPRPLDRTRR